MNKDSVTDYLSYILFKALGPFLRVLPVGASLFLGRRLGDLLFYTDLKHRAIAHANIKRALGSRLDHRQICRLVKSSYRAFGQNFIEIFLIPSIDKDYLKKYITVEGRKNIDAAFKKGKGVIFLAVHAGSWEISNVICSNLGFPFNFIVREQRHPRLNALLNSYRTLRGCKIIHRSNQTREMIEALKRNESIGVTVDQGGREGMLVEFFGQEASMATGAVRLALKYGSVILPAYQVRLKGPYAKVIIGEPFEMVETSDTELDVRENLKKLMPVYEQLIRQYPSEYMWTYKIWKYSRRKNILILSDGKAGHLLQSQAVAQIARQCLEESGIKADIQMQEVRFKSSFCRYAFSAGTLLSGKYICQGCLLCLKKGLDKDNLTELLSKNPDLIISSGSRLAGVNYLLSRQNLAKSVVVMRPGILSLNKFDLVVMPKHDNPARRKNVLATEGAINLISEGYLLEQSEKLALICQGIRASKNIALLLGGDSKFFSLDKETVAEVIKGIKEAAEKEDFNILVTTSRMTSKAVEDLVKKEFRDYGRAKLVVIANEKNIPEAVGGMLGLSSVIVSSPESISMVSEAACSGRYTLVFKAGTLSRKHQRFLDNFASNQYIYLTRATGLADKIIEVLRDKPAVNIPRDRQLVGEAIKKIL